jgi:tellurite methyltransferase
MFSDEAAEQRVAGAILDVRPEVEFRAGHVSGAVNIPLEELSKRIYELSAPEEPLCVFDSSEDRARVAAEILIARQRQVSIVTDPFLDGGGIETGPGRTRLWRPHGLLVEAVRIARDRWGNLADRSALDIACGSGRDSVYLADQGFGVEAWDILPDALEQCAALARHNGVSVRTICLDVEHSELPDHEGTFDLVSCFYFLHRPLWPLVRRLVRPGGLLVYETFVDPQGERFGKPRRPQFILRKNELADTFADWEVISYREHLAAPERIAASLIAQAR